MTDEERKAWEELVEKYQPNVDEVNGLIQWMIDELRRRVKEW